MPDASKWHDVERLLAPHAPHDLGVLAGEPLARHTSLKIGGPARLIARCRTGEGVAACLCACRQSGVPWVVLGQGANVLVPDEGVEALVVNLEGELATLHRSGVRLLGGGGVPLVRVVREAVDAGLAGIECLSGIPGTLGGALAMNAGAYGQEILEVLAWAEVVEGDGTVRRMERWEVEGGYRWSVLGEGRVVTRAEFILRTEDPEALRERVRQVREHRRGVLPPEPSAGSVFRNPPGDYAGRLLELAGCKDLRRGGAMVSPQHANVVVNTGAATARDVTELIAEMAQRVRDQFAVDLELEIKIMANDGSVIKSPLSGLA